MTELEQILTDNVIEARQEIEKLRQECQKIHDKLNEVIDVYNYHSRFNVHGGNSDTVDVLIP